MKEVKITQMSVSKEVAKALMPLLEKAYPFIAPGTNITITSDSGIFHIIETNLRKLRKRNIVWAKLDPLIVTSPVFYPTPLSPNFYPVFRVYHTAFAGTPQQIVLLAPDANSFLLSRLVAYAIYFSKSRYYPSIKAEGGDKKEREYVEVSVASFYLSALEGALVDSIAIWLNPQAKPILEKFDSYLKDLVEGKIRCDELLKAAAELHLTAHAGFTLSSASYLDKEIARLREMYVETPTHEIARDFARTFFEKHVAPRLNLRKLRHARYLGVEERERFDGFAEDVFKVELGGEHE